MFYIYQIIILFVLLLLLSSIIGKKYWKIIFSIVASTFLTLEIVAIHITGNLVDYRFFNHMNINAIEGHGFQYVTEFILFTIFFLLIIFLFYFGSKRIINKDKFFTPIVIVSFIFLCIPNGILNELYGIYEILNAQEKSFKEALIDLKISPDEYIKPNQLTATKGKNIIVISIESLEQGFLGSNFENISPNIKRLSNEWTYYNKMPSAPGGYWTIASLYNYQVGMPAFFKGQGNKIFQDTADVKLTGLGHILKKAGYNSRYLVGNKEFAGLSDLLTAYGMPVISEKNSIGKEYQKVRWGLNDLDLFKEAKLQLKALTEDTDKPFALFISTVNTHSPNGIYDKRMEKFISKRKNNLEFSISSIDYLVNDFIKFIKHENIFNNTAIFIFPDHLLMSSNSQVMEKLKKTKRQLYLITNTIESDLPKKTTNTIYQIDLPKMIVSGAKINTNAKFLIDFIDNNDVINFLKNNKVKLTTLNTASIIKSDYLNLNLESLAIKFNDKLALLNFNLFETLEQQNINANLYGKDNRRFIAHAGGSIDNYKYTNSLEALNFNYKNGFRLFELDIIKTSDNIYVAAHDWDHWSKITDYRGSLPPSQKVFLEQKIYTKYSPMDMGSINSWFSEHSDAILVTDKVNTPIDFSNKFIDKSRLMMELFTWDAVKKGISAKINSSMPTYGILSAIKGNKINYLINLGIKDIAASYRIINTHKELINNIVNSGINIFAFHLNTDKGKNETYIVCNEQEAFYGMYADQWDFNATIDCSKH
ncbi:MAG: sulfatase-like hydrolase/transferase [gamma proteobacterium symbiont of Taylorina sp.]|nr:sulfatase-like hydrolase/transferase [gamma proteobacterium symbiont of Taylorina sp.]